jgi:hypothetical protein
MDTLLVEVFVESHAVPPKKIVMDVDATDDPLHGDQGEPIRQRNPHLLKHKQGIGGGAQRQRRLVVQPFDDYGNARDEARRWNRVACPRPSCFPPVATPPSKGLPLHLPPTRALNRSQYVRPTSASAQLTHIFSRSRRRVRGRECAGVGRGLASRRNTGHRKAAPTSSPAGLEGTGQIRFQSVGDDERRVKTAVPGTTSTYPSPR